MPSTILCFFATPDLAQHSGDLLVHGFAARYAPGGWHFMELGHAVEMPVRLVTRPLARFA